jgi:O-methyltransferase
MFEHPSAQQTLPRASGPRVPAALYLELMKKCLTRSGFDESFRTLMPKRGVNRVLWLLIRAMLDVVDLELVRRVRVDPSARAEGRDWPSSAETMIGLRRLDNIEACVTVALRDGVPGDMLEAGVWRGGAVIFMRAILAAYEETDRVVWVADSFRGLPRPDAERYPDDAGDLGWTQARLAASLDEVKENFRRYGLLDGRVRFLVGWFRDTLPTAPVDRLAVLRLDGDLYESIMDSLTHLYPKLSPGGFLIVDDYGSLMTTRAAVDDYRRAHSITEPMEFIDWAGAFWRRSA